MTTTTDQPTLWQRDSFSLAVLLVVVLAFFLPAFIQPGVMLWPSNNPTGSDIIYRHWPDLAVFGDNLRSGSLPIWDKSVNLGRPLAGDATVLFLYPLTVLFAVIRPPLAFNVFMALHVLLAGFWMWMLLRHGYRTSPVAALLGGLAFAFAPKLIAHLLAGHVGVIAALSWAPAVILGLKYALDGGPLLTAALGGAALGIVLPTHIQVPYYTAGASSALMLWYLALQVWQAARGDGARWRDAGRTLAAWGVWLLSFLVISAAVTLPLLELLPFNSREGFSLASSNEYYLPLGFLVTLFADVFDAEINHEWVVSVGLMMPVMAGFAVWFARSKPQRWFWAAMVGLTLLYSLGTATPLFALGYYLVPGLSIFRVPPRAWFFGGLALALLAGLVADGLNADDARNRFSARLPLLRRLYFITLVASIVTLIAWPLITGQFLDDLAWQTLALVGFALLIWRWYTERLNATQVQWALVLLLAIDLLPRAAALTTTVDASTEFYAPDPAYEFIAAQRSDDTEPWRIFSDKLTYPAHAWLGEQRLETLDAGLAFQVGHAVYLNRTAAGCLSEKYSTWIPVCEIDGEDYARLPDADLLGLLNVRYIVTQRALDVPGLERVYDETLIVYENTRWQPRTTLVDGGEAAITDYRAGYYAISASAPQATTLRVSSTWLPGWRATVNGQPVETTMIDDGLIGLPLPAGDSAVVLRYSPTPWRVGSTVSVAGLLGLALWTSLVFVQRRRSARRTSANHTTPANTPEEKV